MDQDLFLIVSDYLKPLDISADILNKVVSFYKSVKKLARTSLLDGTGHLPTFSLRTLCRALNIAAKNPCQNALRSLKVRRVYSLIIILFTKCTVWIVIKLYFFILYIILIKIFVG